MEHLHSFKVFPHKTLINCKGKKSSLIVENPSRHHATQELKVYFTSNRINQDHVQYYGMP